jgi:hypothetical protein
MTNDENRQATHEFDSNLLVVEQIGALKNDTKRTLSDLLSHPIVNSNHVGRRRSHCGGRGGHRTTFEECLGRETESFGRGNGVDRVWNGSVLAKNRCL